MNAILFSPGLDSWCAYKLLSETAEWEPYYVVLGTRYTAKELAAFNQHPLLPALPTLVTNLNLGATAVLDSIERPDGFVPQRNLLILALVQAISDADQIALNAVAGEFSRDKHPTFFAKASELLSYTAGKPVKVFSPLIDMTKSEAVKHYLKSGHSAEELLRTVSCYDSQSTACGRCMSCFRRWTALENNGLVQQWDYEPQKWVRRAHKPATDLKQLPPATWGSFTRAQRDVLTAWGRWRIRHLRTRT